MQDIHPAYSEPKFISALIFEIKSRIGRQFCTRRSRFPKDNNVFLIDIGAGQNFTKGWCHVGFFSFPLRFRTNRSKGKHYEVETDLRFPLECPSNVADGIYSSHTLEHLYPNHAQHLLYELFRILKPGSWLRIIVPDLKSVIDIYNGKNNNTKFKYKAECIGNLTQNYGHHSVWDEELLSETLADVGFINIRSVKFGSEGTDARLIKEEPVRRDESLVVEAQKPLN